MKITPKDILQMKIGDKISRSEMKTVITESKKPSSKDYFQGSEYSIGNTYQQGIHWIGNFNNPKAVIIKSKQGKYINDEEMHYALQSRKERKSNKKIVDENSKANRAVINSKDKKYPLLYFVDIGTGWVFKGKFIVKNINGKDVELMEYFDKTNIDSNIPFTEGNIKIQQHIVYERNLAIIKKIKDERDWKCDICNLVMEKEYGIKFIEAHHKIKLSSFTESHEVKESDIVLICPNCHTATHYFMKEDIEYDIIKKNIQEKLKQGHGT